MDGEDQMRHQHGRHTPEGRRLPVIGAVRAVRSELCRGDAVDSLWGAATNLRVFDDTACMVQMQMMSVDAQGSRADLAASDVDVDVSDLSLAAVVARHSDVHPELPRSDE